MGYASYSSNAYKAFSLDSKNMDKKELFNKDIEATNLATNIVVRESRDSVLHPNSIAIIILLDVTGSMGNVIENLIKVELNNIFQLLLDKGIADPQVLFGAIGDAYYDSKPAIQVQQFESGTDETIKALRSLHITGQGGGDYSESYLLGWIFAGMKTSIDCFEKRGIKGFLFTIGDEANHKIMTLDKLQKEIGGTFEKEITDEEALKKASEMYEVFHINIEENTNCGQSSTTENYWKSMLGERFISIGPYTDVAKTITSIIGVMNDKNMTDVVNTMSETTQVAITKFANSTSIIRKSDTDTDIVQIWKTFI